jgi:ethanolamine permease
VVLTIAFLAWLNYRGVFMTLTLNFVITRRLRCHHRAVLRRQRDRRAGPADARRLLTELPYGWIGVLAALHFGIWYYLGIEGTCQAAEEVRSPAARCRSARWAA